MKRRLTQDVLAGGMFIAFGIAALILGRTNPVGTSSEMGSGYFPTLLGGLLICVGLIVTTLGLRRDGERVASWSAGACACICSAFVLFAVIIEWAGLLVTAPACMLIAALGGAPFRTWPQIVLAIAATLIAAAVFIWGLKIPIPLLPSI